MKYHGAYQTKILPANKLTHKVLKILPNSIILIMAKSKGRGKEDKEVVVTLLSNGSSNLFKDKSYTLFANNLHTPISWNPFSYNYIALQEIGISLNSGNIRIPNEKPAIIYFEWDTTFSYH